MAVFRVLFLMHYTQLEVASIAVQFAVSEQVYRDVEVSITRDYPVVQAVHPRTESVEVQAEEIGVVRRAAVTSRIARLNTFILIYNSNLMAKFISH